MNEQKEFPATGSETPEDAQIKLIPEISGGPATSITKELFGDIVGEVLAAQQRGEKRPERAASAQLNQTPELVRAVMRTHQRRMSAMADRARQNPALESPPPQPQLPKPERDHWLPAEIDREDETD